MTHYPYMRPASGIVDYETPKELFDELNKEFQFTLDVAADTTNHKTTIWYDKKIDALKQPWNGRVYCNPPYGKDIPKFVEKAFNEITTNDKCEIIVMLLPSRTDTKWFHDYVYNHAEVRFIKGRLKFGKEENSAPFPSMIVIFKPSQNKGEIDRMINTETWLCGPPPAKGQYQRYPSRFIYNIKKKYPQMLEQTALHMFSGSSKLATTTDIRVETKPDICSAYDKIPCKDEAFTAILADPPYANHYANEWHSELPKPKKILEEATRLVKPNGLIGILHIIIIPAYKKLGVKRIALHPILTGPNNAIRVFNVFRKQQSGD